MDGHRIGMPIVAFIWSILLVNMNCGGIVLAWWSAFIGQCINAPWSKSRPPTLVYLSTVNILHHKPGLHQPRPHVPCLIGQHAAWSTCGLHYMDIDPGTCQPEYMLTAGHVDHRTCWPWDMSAMAHVDCSTCQLGYMWTRHMSTFIHVNCHTGVHVNQINGVDRGKCWLGHVSTSVHVDCSMWWLRCMWPQ